MSTDRTVNWRQPAGTSSCQNFDIVSVHIRKEENLICLTVPHCVPCHRSPRDGHAGMLQWIFLQWRTAQTFSFGLLVLHFASIWHRHQQPSVLLHVRQCSTMQYHHHWHSVQGVTGVEQNDHGVQLTNLQEGLEFEWFRYARQAVLTAMGKAVRDSTFKRHDSHFDVT